MFHLLVTGNHVMPQLKFVVEIDNLCVKDLWRKSKDDKSRYSKRFGQIF